MQALLAARFPGKRLLSMSALTGEGVDAWLQSVAGQASTGQAPAGRHVVQVDYDTYAAGEAALGWLNASVTLAPVFRWIGRRLPRNCWRRFASR